MTLNRSIDETSLYEHSCFAAENTLVGNADECGTKVSDISCYDVVRKRLFELIDDVVLLLETQLVIDQVLSYIEKHELKCDVIGKDCLPSEAAPSDINQQQSICVPANAKLASCSNMLTLVDKLIIEPTDVKECQEEIGNDVHNAVSATVNNTGYDISLSSIRHDYAEEVVETVQFNRLSFIDQFVNNLIISAINSFIKQVFDVHTLSLDGALNNINMEEDNENVLQKSETEESHSTNNLRVVRFNDSVNVSKIPDFSAEDNSNIQSSNSSDDLNDYILLADRVASEVIVSSQQYFEAECINREVEELINFIIKEVSLEMVVVTKEKESLSDISAALIVENHVDNNKHDCTDTDTKSLIDASIESTGNEENFSDLCFVDDPAVKNDETEQVVQLMPTQSSLYEDESDDTEKHLSKTSQKESFDEINYNSANPPSGFSSVNVSEFYDSSASDISALKAPAVLPEVDKTENLCVKMDYASSSDSTACDNFTEAIDLPVLNDSVTTTELIDTTENCLMKDDVSESNSDSARTSEFDSAQEDICVDDFESNIDNPVESTCQSQLQEESTVKVTNIADDAIAEQITETTNHTENTLAEVNMKESNHDSLVSHHDEEIASDKEEVITTSKDEESDTSEGFVESNHDSSVSHHDEEIANDKEEVITTSKDEESYISEGSVESNHDSLVSRHDEEIASDKEEVITTSKDEESDTSEGFVESNHDSSVSHHDEEIANDKEEVITTSKDEESYISEGSVESNHDSLVSRHDEEIASDKEEVITTSEDEESDISEGSVEERERRETRLTEKGIELLKQKQLLNQRGIKWGLKPILPTAQTNHSSTSLFTKSDQNSNFNIEDFSSSQELKNAFLEMEEKYRQAMVHTAQLDNERSQLQYQAEQLRDLLEEEEDSFYRLNAQHKRTCQELERQRRAYDSLEKKYYGLEEALQQRDELIHELETKQKKEGALQSEVFHLKETLSWQDKKIKALLSKIKRPHQRALISNREQGLVLVGDTNRDPVNCSETDYGHDRPGLALVTPEVAKLLESAGDGPLDLLLKRLAEEKQDLMDQVRRLKNDLEEEQRKGMFNGREEPVQSHHHIPEMELLEIQREANRQVNEYKLKLQKSEQDVAACQGNIGRLESQLNRVKQTCETYEKNEDEMRAEKRKLMRDLRTALDRIEEMEMTNSHLEKRLDRLRASRTTVGQT